MFRKTKICIAAMLAASGGSLLLAGNALAQQSLERVEVTGSSIKRIAAEGALPVLTLSRADIERSGAKSAEDLIQNLPSMQGFYASAESVNGNAGGVQTASLHSIGHRYTLVLLNGRRVASYDAGSAVNLSSIPLAVIERVEVLTDGASALYGSDAVAGVVNFITRKNQTELAIDLNKNMPEAKGGGDSSNVSLSKGFGNLEQDGFNVFAAFSRDKQAGLDAKDRDYAKSGVMQFNEGGKRYSLYQLAVNTAPASVNLNLTNPMMKDGEEISALIFSPNYMKDGKCSPNTALSTTGLDKACWYDYGATVQLIPTSKRDSLMLAGNAKLNADTTLFAEYVYADFELAGRFAPPAQVISLALTDPLYAQYVSPHLAALGVDPANVSKASTNNRFVDAGGRQMLYKTKSNHLAVGVEGLFMGYDYTASYVHSESKRDAMYDGGFMSRNCYNTLIASGKVNPFAEPGGNQALFAPCVLKSLQDRTKTSLDVASLRASGELFKGPAGPAMLGAGFDYTKQKYELLPSEISQGPNKLHNGTDTPFGSAPGALPVGASRNNWGVFAELLVPLHKTLEVTGAVRYDDYSKVRNEYIFKDDGTLDKPGSQGNANNKATYKLALRFRPIDSVMVRGSYGTGFKAPNLDEITKPISDFGVTSGKYPCPVKAPDPRAADCKGTTQYDLLAGGNPLSGANGLKPEESKNATLGLRVEPTRDISVGLDYWSVRMKNQIVAMPETFPFRDPAKYNDLFFTVFDAGQGQNKLATLLPNFNLGSSRYSGVDWDATANFGTMLGKLRLDWSGTYMIRSEVEIAGTVESSVGRFDAYNNATSRVVQRISANLKPSDAWSHTLTYNWRSGYTDQVITEDDGSLKFVNPDGSLGDYAGLKRKVKAYSTVDWQTRFQLNKMLNFTAGIKNLLDKDPPLSIRIAGGGNQVGYDGRYASPLGRQFYVSAGLRY
ncbi:TonB-dependent receptor [Roseateles sp. DAIF2]|nr:TonB-dependent receptor [Roseateles sp. DAIF2]